jgi:hypothetical protein
LRENEIYFNVRDDVAFFKADFAENRGLFVSIRDGKFFATGFECSDAAGYIYKTA